MLLALWKALLAQSGGTWPPTADFEMTATPLLQLVELSKKASSRISKTAVDGLGMADVLSNRQYIQENLPTSESVMLALQSLDQRQLLGAAGCIAFLSHLYRWGIVPVIAAAQDDTCSSLPPTLKEAFRYVNQRMDFQTGGGTMMTMTYCNYRADIDSLMYSTTAGLGAPYTLAETWNARLFVQMERLSTPFYNAIVCFCHEVGQGIDSSALNAGGILAVRDAFKYFYRNLQDSVVPKAFWMSHAQGFHGWGWNGDEGVSGDQAMVIRTLDAALGIPPSSPPTHLSGAQRAFLDHLRSLKLREQTKDMVVAQQSLTELLRILKTWRLGHIKKALYYEDLQLPERRPMTAGSGVDASEGLQGLLTKLEAGMKGRIAMTK